MKVLLHRENNQHHDTSLTYCKWQLNIAIVIGLLLQVSNAVRYETKIELKLMMLDFAREHNLYG